MVRVLREFRAEELIRTERDRIIIVDPSSSPANKGGTEVPDAPVIRVRTLRTMTTTTQGVSTRAGSRRKATAELPWRANRAQPPGAYGEHRRVWNASIDRYPALIARCAGVADVIAAVSFARPDLLVAVRGGGHSFPGFAVCDDGMVIDLSLMKRDPQSIRSAHARAQGGVLLGELDRDDAAFWLRRPRRVLSHTGAWPG